MALADLKLERLLVVHSGSKSYPLAPKAEAVSIAEVRNRLESL